MSWPWDLKENLEKVPKFIVSPMVVSKMEGCRKTCLLSWWLYSPNSLRLIIIWMLRFPIFLPLQLHTGENWICVDTLRCEEHKVQAANLELLRVGCGWVEPLAFQGFMRHFISCQLEFFALWFKTLESPHGSYCKLEIHVLLAATSCAWVWADTGLSVPPGVQNQPVCWGVCDHLSQSLPQRLQPGLQLCWSCQLLHRGLGMFQNGLSPSEQFQSCS